MLTTPRLKTYSVPFDARNPITLEFTATSGDQIFKNELVVQKVSDNTTVYSSIATTFAFSHTIPLNTLTNGITYKARIRTYNISNATSSWSDYIIFKCLSVPVIGITNIPSDGIVRNQTFTFQGSYSQAEGDTLYSYMFILCDANGIQLSVGSEKTDGLLQYEFTGLESELHYKIQMKVLTDSGYEVSTALVPFTVDYVQPRMANVISLENDYDNASVKVNIKAIQILFQTKSGSYTFEDNDWINLQNGVIYTDKANGFELNGDFTLTARIKFPVIDNNNLQFLKLTGINNDYILLEKYMEKIYLTYYKDNKIQYRLISSALTGLTTSNTVFIWVQKSGVLMDLKAQII